MTAPEQPTVTNGWPIRTLLWVAVAMLVLAIPPLWPYGYYTLLRLVVCAVSILATVVASSSRSGLMVPLIIVALLFNPLIPVHLNKEMWSVIDLAAAVFLGVVAVRLPPSWRP